MHDTVSGRQFRLASCLLVLALLATACGCRSRSTPVASPAGPSPSPAPVGIAGPYPVATAVPQAEPPPSATLASIVTTPAAGYIGKQPFLVRCALHWQDPLESYLALSPLIPTTRERFDPRALRPPEPALLIWLNAAKLRPGQWEMSSRHPGYPLDAPVKQVNLQVPFDASPLPAGLPRRAVVSRGGWSLALRIDSVVHRKSLHGDLAGISLAGSLCVRLDDGPTWINGRFVAHDTLRDEEVAPGQPTVPTPPVPAPR